MTETETATETETETETAGTIERIGTNRLVAIGVLAIPFTVATVAMFTGRGDFAAWAGFVQVQTPTALGILLGASAYLKARGR